MGISYSEIQKEDGKMRILTTKISIVASNPGAVVIGSYYAPEEGTALEQLHTKKQRTNIKTHLKKKVQ